MESMNRKEEIAEILRGQGVHPVMTLPTLDEYDYGMSPFELFVLKGKKVTLRRILDQCSISFSKNEDGARQFQLAIKGLGSNAFYGTNFNAKVPAEIESGIDPVSQFGGAVNDSPFFEAWSHLWMDTILLEFSSILSDWYTWKQVVGGRKYSASHLIIFGSPNVLEQNISQAIGKSLFTSLDSFLLKPVSEGNTQKALRCGRWYDGLTPSLHTLIQVLEEITQEKVSVPIGWMESAPFNDAQLETLSRIKSALKKFANPDRFWKDLVDHSDFDQNSRAKSLDLLIKLADEQAADENRKEELLATYIRTSRNAMAHNRDPLDLHENYLLRVGYEGASEKLIEQAVDTIFDFLMQIHTGVFGLNRQSLLDWKQEAETKARSIGLELATTLRETALEKHFMVHADQNRQWRFRNLASPKEHKCQLPSRYRPPFLIQQPILHYCKECNGVIHVIYLERALRVEAILDTGERLPVHKPRKLIMVEGVYGITSISIEHAKPDDEVIDITEEEKIYLHLWFHGEVLWQGDCFRDKFAFPGKLDCIASQLFQLPFSRYAEIEKSKEASDAIRLSA